ncbi:MAG: helix-turn-helix domain-containing protein [Polyangiaceae bacterium]
MAMLVDHGYSVADVARMLDCSARRVRRAYASFREAPEETPSEVIVH